MNVSELIRRAAGAVVELVYPSRAVCVGCGMKAGFAEPWLCERCRSALRDERWTEQVPPGLDGIAVCREYHGPAGGAVRALKYHGVTALAEPMGRRMAESVCAEGFEQYVDVVSYVPMHRHRRRTRGFNQSERLAGVLAKELGLPCEELLVRTRNTRQQARLDAVGRRSNLKDAFLAQNTRGRCVLLVDDVVTTGETARCCAEALLAAGAADVYLAAYAIDR